MDKETLPESCNESLDRLLEVMHHFYCEEPKELEGMLQLPEDSLAEMFRTSARRIPEKVIDILEIAGIRREFIINGTGSMFSSTMTIQCLEIMKRYAAHLLKVICNHYRRYSQSDSKVGIHYHVTDRRTDQTAIEEELIDLLIEALSDKNSRERLLSFIRGEIANRAIRKKNCR